MLHPIHSGPWHTDPRAVALLARCHAEPPVAERHVKTYVLTRDEWVTYIGPIADGLRAIREKYGQHFMAVSDATGAEADYHRMVTHLRSPSVEDVIDDAMADAVRSNPAALTDLMVAICRPARLAA